MILKETLNFNNSQLVVEAKENASGKKDLYMQGIFIQGGVKNLNQRVYPVHEIKSAVEQINQTISGGESVLGECDHPQELTINIDRVSHNIEKMWMDGNNGMGKLKIIPTPHGKIIETLLESGIKLGVSSRGSGDVDHIGNVSSFEIVTVDIVAKPSAAQAFPSVIYEAYNRQNGGEITKLAEAARYDSRAQHFLKSELSSFIDSLR